jgi:hypothetical protein
VKDPLINPTWKEMVDEEPLIAFSWYLAGRKNCLMDLGDEIIGNLDAAFADCPVDGGRVARAEQLTWLWVLGAYEVIRTMSQADQCFAPELATALGALKCKLARARIPAAKMERPRKREPVPSDRSPADWDHAGRDLFVGDPTSLRMSARQLVSEFRELVASIKPADIVKRHEESFGGSKSSA